MRKNARISIAIDNFAAFFNQTWGSVKVERLYPSIFSHEELRKLNKAEKIRKILWTYKDERTIFKNIIKRIIGIHAKFSEENIEELREIVKGFGFSIEDDLTLVDTRKKDEFDYDVALSFAGEDRECAENLAEALKSHDVRVFYDAFEKAKLWGEDLYTYLAELYTKRARYCVMFLSKHYATKLWTNHERKAAQARAFKESKAYILPIRLDETKIPGIFETIAYLNWHDEGVNKITAYILEKLEISDTSTRLASHSTKPGITMKEAEKIAIELVKTKDEDASEIDVSSAEKENEEWIIKGSFSTRINGLPWPFNFEVRINENGEVKSYNLNA